MRKTYHGRPASKPVCTGTLSYGQKVAKGVAHGVDRFIAGQVAKAHKATSKVENILHVAKAVVMATPEEKRWDPAEARRDERSQRDYANALIDGGFTSSREWGGSCH